MTALTRGPLPARVYWRRRLVLLVLAVGLVVGSVRLLGLGSDASGEERPQATQVAAETGEDTDEPGVTASNTPSESRGQQSSEKAKAEKRDRGPVLAEPDGVCADRDVAVTPSVRRPFGGGPVTFTLELRTITTPACTWHVSPTTMTMRITSGDDDIWSSQDCPRAIPTDDVVVRNNVGTEVEVTWSGRRSDDDCSRLTDWAMPGWYYVDAAALAGEPSDLHFELLKPEPGVVTKTVKPDEKQSDGKQSDGKQSDGKQSDEEKQGRQGSDRNG